MWEYLDIHLQTPGLLCESVVVGGDPVLDEACLQQLRHCYVAVVGLKFPSFYSFTLFIFIKRNTEGFGTSLCTVPFLHEINLH